MAKYIMGVYHGTQVETEYPMYVIKVSNKRYVMKVCHGGMSWLVGVCHEVIPWRSISWEHIMVPKLKPSTQCIHSLTQVVGSELFVWSIRPEVALPFLTHWSLAASCVCLVVTSYVMPAHLSEGPPD